MVPKKIQTYFKPILRKKNGNNSLIEGRLVCCDSQDFEVFTVGKIKHNMFSMCLFPINDKIVLQARCQKCGKVISIFDNSCDGYGQCERHQPVLSLEKTIGCRKCQGGSWTVGIKYEYPDTRELEELGIAEIDNAFTWIWITLECNKCGVKYKNFIDFETT